MTTTRSSWTPPKQTPSFPATDLRTPAPAPSTDVLPGSFYRTRGFYFYRALASISIALGFLYPVSTLPFYRRLAPWLFFYRRRRP